MGEPVELVRSGQGAKGVDARTRAADEALIASALGGDREAFGVLVVRHQRSLVNYLFRLTGNRETAMDLAQDVFIKVYQSLGTFDPTYRFTTWLYRIASNAAIDHIRRRPPRVFALPDDEPPHARRNGASLASSGPSPLEVARMRQTERRIDRALATLPPAYRQLILLRHRQHCRYDEIARITRLPLGTVKNRIFRAREILRRELADILDEEV